MFSNPFVFGVILLLALFIVQVAVPFCLGVVWLKRKELWVQSLKSRGT